MIDKFNKLVKFVAVTAISAAAFLALCILELFAFIGANQLYMTELPKAIILGLQTNTFVVLGNAMIVQLVNLTFLYLGVFIVGFWLCTSVWIFYDDLAVVAGKLKNGLKSFVGAFMGDYVR